MEALRPLLCSRFQIRHTTAGGHEGRTRHDATIPERMLDCFLTSKLESKSDGLTPPLHVRYTP